MDGDDDKSILCTWEENEYLYAPQPVGSHVCKEIPFPHNSESLGC